MRIKKAALLAAASATLVLAGAGSAAAYGAPTDGYGRSSSGLSDGGITFINQVNNCDASLGWYIPVPGAGTEGDTNVTTNCNNVISG
ncbi:hypothetical protein HUT19_28075 [Streptomyces sp. NA02950]|uniref:hypothetical protein n=1 Tax=Streptomyces sp. NA02950 TaxID=2742137 RepID=UPI0015922ED9|nr:hypothetical protein [Streptomyces sp. NA02950]QKV95122.1 hypothetical protein HUT19_28075 [Streptomyces sp. NA02950]